MAGCGKLMTEYYGAWMQKTRTVKCGSGYDTRGMLRLCMECMRRCEEQYPQGWRFYPGDTCKHGNYVGGSGADYMCGRCESEKED